MPVVGLLCNFEILVFGCGGVIICDV